MALIGQALLSIIAKCPQFRRFQCIEVYEDMYTLGLLELSVLSLVSVVEGVH